MAEEIKNLLRRWVSLENGHPYDYHRLYEIVAKTYQNKIDEDEFEKEVGKELSEKYYSLYEHLCEFAEYIKCSEY